MSVPDNREAVRQHFGTGADRYDARHYGSRYRTYIGDRQRLVTKVLEGLGLPPGARVLDVACGPGHFLQVAIEHRLEGVGIDSSRDMLRASRGRLGEGARLVLGDAMGLPFRSCSFDAVNCSGLIEYLPEPMPMLREFRRVLKPDGRAMVSSTNRISPAMALSPFINALRRSATLQRLIRALRVPVEEASLRDRGFRFTFHTPGRFTKLLRDAGFEDLEMHYCHLQLLPHPLDRIAPAATTACVTVTDRLLGVRPLRLLAEGLLAVGQRRD
jgi:ubiquinone/menaquinone biosynthesis C-methylase UbiE